MDILLEFLHNAGFVLGTGVALTSGILNIRSQKDERLQPVMPILNKIFPRMIWIGIIAMLIVHTFELFQEPVLLHWAKEGVMVAIAAIALWLTFAVLPRLARLAPKPGEAPTQEFMRLRGRVQSSIPIVLLLWAADYVINSIYFTFVHAA